MATQFGNVSWSGIDGDRIGLHGYVKYVNIGGIYCPPSENIKSGKIYPLKSFLIFMFVGVYIYRERCMQVPTCLVAQIWNTGPTDIGDSTLGIRMRIMLSTL